VTDLVTIGWLTLDDIVLPDRSYEQDVLGGGALYSAIGAQIWNDDVGIHSVTGRPYLEFVKAGLELRGLDAAGVSAIDGNGLQLWILHESDTDKQQIPKLSSSGAAEMDSGRGSLPDSYREARGFHIAPQGSASTFATLRALGALPTRPVLTLDVLADAYVDPRGYQDLSFLQGLTAFLPSDAEIERLWAPADLEGWLAEQARMGGCHVAAKLGDQGSIVCAAGGGALHRVPIYPAHVVDTTGAGDAYCGGFLAGLVGGRPVAECAAMGTVSASYVVESRGALATSRPAAAERDARLADVMARIVSEEPAK
jgi:sugar/nucleoside kinase (ribokinase family)